MVGNIEALLFHFHLYYLKSGSSRSFEPTFPTLIKLNDRQRVGRGNDFIFRNVELEVLVVYVYSWMSDFEVGWQPCKISIFNQLMT